ncbi:MAG: SDR family oxidoreductase [Mesorhizobium sp.]|uniref:SDR family oxidoreductase n=1 Tax=Mesorhizobium sp. TaxID=1871066 RepID=UPI000FE5EB5A|nr:SDR family oxidoreductase [Mesorhizobium sp.]RWA98514.1 MAG: SDR family oxidoreductase [Mesorhizobium sp.]RWB10853.1 MAG: SDR family oxidoreductase [Mesorhizobium sp.]
MRHHRPPRADVGNPGDTERVVADVLARDGRIDVLVNNAGLGGARKPVETFSVEEWHRVFDVNIHGAFYLMRAIMPGMKDRRSGAIVNISTVKTGVPQRSVYIVPTALARELGPFGITCNAVLPGFVNNARGKMLLEAAAARNGLTLEEQLRRRLSFISMRRPVSEGDIAEMVEFPAAPRASVVSGQFISVDGHNEWEGDPIY